MLLSPSYSSLYSLSVLYILLNYLLLVKIPLIAYFTIVSRETYCLLIVLFSFNAALRIRIILRLSCFNISPVNSLRVIVSDF
jgi:hypothetical protein